MKWRIKQFARVNLNQGGRKLFGKLRTGYPAWRWKIPTGLKYAHLLSAGNFCSAESAEWLRSLHQNKKHPKRCRVPASEQPVPTPASNGPTSSAEKVPFASLTTPKIKLNWVSTARSVSCFNGGILTIRGIPPFQFPAAVFWISCSSKNSTGAIVSSPPYRFAFVLFRVRFTFDFCWRDFYEKNSAARIRFSDFLPATCISYCRFVISL